MAQAANSSLKGLSGSPQGIQYVECSLEDGVRTFNTRRVKAVAIIPDGADSSQYMVMTGIVDGKSLECIAFTADDGKQRFVERNHDEFKNNTFCPQLVKYISPPASAGSKKRIPVKIDYTNDRQQDFYRHEYRLVLDHDSIQKKLATELAAAKEQQKNLAQLSLMTIVKCLRLASTCF